MQDVEQLTDGATRMGPGTLYGTIKRMLSAGLIEEADERPDPELDDERRRYYRITRLGMQVLQAESTRLANLLSAARAKKCWPARGVPPGHGSHADPSHGILRNREPAQQSRVRLAQRRRPSPRRGDACSSSRRAQRVALSLVLLAGTGLFLRGLVHALNTPLGFVHDRVATASVNLGLARYTAARAADFYSSAIESVRTIPNVAAAAWGSLIPTNGSMMASVQIEGYVPTPDETPRVLLSQVGPDYFRTLETRILSGRSFTPGDDTSAPRVAIVNEAAARTYWGGRDPVGGRLKMDDGEWVTVIGIAENSILGDLGEESFPFVYFPFDQDIGFGNLLGPAHLLVRTEGDPADVLPAVRDRLRALGPQVPIFDLHPLSFHIKELLMPQQMGAALFSIFSVLAVSLAIIGIYGVASYVVGLRTREIGIRIALGADRRTIGRLLLLEGLPPIAAGIAIGIGLAMWAAGFATALVYGVSPWDLATLVGVTTLLAALALLASYLPARRAAHLDPIVALRQD